jgi:hypothetical protein
MALGLGPAARPHNAAMSLNSRNATMRIRPLFAWYDLWVGAFWDRKQRKLYICPLPCIGVVITFN